MTKKDKTKKKLERETTLKPKRTILENIMRNLVQLDRFRLPIKGQCYHNMETSQLICHSNHVISFYTMTNLIFDGYTITMYKILSCKYVTDANQKPLLQMYELYAII